MNYVADPDGNPARPQAGEPLCPLADLAPGEPRRLLFTSGEVEFRGFLVLTDKGLRGYIDWCPHYGIPLQEGNKPLMIRDGCAVCTWHFAQFRLTDGGGVWGQTYEGLHPWPVTVDAAGMVRTV